MNRLTAVLSAGLLFIGISLAMAQNKPAADETKGQLEQYTQNKQNLRNKLMIKKSTFTSVADIGSRGMRGNSVPRHKLSYYEKKVILPKENELEAFADKPVYSMKIVCVLATVIEPYKDWGYYGNEMPTVNKALTAEKFISLLQSNSQNTTFYHIFTHTFDMPINSEKWLSLKMGQGSDILSVNETKEKPIHTEFDRSPIIDLNVKALTKKNIKDIFVFLQLNGYFIFEGRGNSNSPKEQAILPYGKDSAIIGGQKYFEGATMEIIDIFGNPSESEKIKYIRDVEKSYIFLVSMEKIK